MISTWSALPYSELTREIVGAYHETVHELGRGFSEDVSKRAFQIVLRDRGLLAELEFGLEVKFRGERIGSFKADIVVERLVLIEVKATSKIDDWMKAQVLNYVRVGGGGIGFSPTSGSKA